MCHAFSLNHAQSQRTCFQHSLVVHVQGRVPVSPVSPTTFPFSTVLSVMYRGECRSDQLPERGSLSVQISSQRKVHGRYLFVSARLQTGSWAFSLCFCAFSDRFAGSVFWFLRIFRQVRRLYFFVSAHLDADKLWAFLVSRIHALASSSASIAQPPTPILHAMRCARASDRTPAHQRLISTHAQPPIPTRTHAHT